MSNSDKRLLVIDDEPSLRHLLRTILTSEGYLVDEAENGRCGLEQLRQQTYELVLCDIRMPELDGMGFIRAALQQYPQQIIIMMSAYGNVETALECMRAGAYDYISKPFRPDEIVLTLKKACERLRLQRENSVLRQQLSRGAAAARTVGSSAAMCKLMDKVATLAQVNSPVLIHGETGTGKELVARALHDGSPRAKQPFVAINCSAIAANLIESELFGHRKGAFTGADKNHPGLFAAAGNGTLFLDEIGELPLETQPKLLRVLQEGEVRPVGETRPRKINARIVAATACDLKQAVADGTFREDLYYRLAVVELELPPLRQRSEDIPALCHHFLRRIARREQRPQPQLSATALEILQNYPWPGNVRELENAMEKIMIFHSSDTIASADLPPELTTASASTVTSASAPDNLSLKQAIARLERNHISAALEKTGGNRVQAAKLLEISLRSLHYKIKEYGL